MIPVLAIPVLNRPDLLAATVASIDHPVGTLLIIDNSPELGMGDVAEEHQPACVGELVVTEPPTNLGVAASWNLAIRSYPAAPWWAIVNADIEFAPGALAALDEAMTDAAEVRCLVEFGAFGITAEAIDRVGFFDENFYPVYVEDTDYRRRCALLGVPIYDIPNDTTHVGSVSYRGNPRAKNASTYPENVAYYRAKWGGWLGNERYTTPFDAGGPVDHWRLDRRRLASQAW